MIRKKKEKDLEILWKLWENEFTSSHFFLDASILTPMRSSFFNSEIYLYEEDQILGFIAIKNASIIAFAVSYYSQNEGIGKALLHYVKNRYSYLETTIYAKNNKVRTLLEKNGFMVIKKQQDSRNQELQYQMRYKKNALCQ